MLSKHYESIEVDHRTWIHVPSGTPWYTSSDTHQVRICLFTKLPSLNDSKEILIFNLNNSEPIKYKYIYQSVGFNNDIPWKQW